MDVRLVGPEGTSPALAATGTAAEFDLLREGMDLLAQDPNISWGDGQTIAVDPEAAGSFRDGLGEKIQPVRTAAVSQSLEKFEITNLSFTEAAVAAAGCVKAMTYYAALAAKPTPEAADALAKSLTAFSAAHKLAIFASLQDLPPR